MQNIKLSLIVVLLLLGLFVKAISIEEAIKKGCIQLRIESKADRTTYYGQCISLVITNNTSRTLKLNMKAGILLIPEDSLTQEMIISEDIPFVIKPNDSLQEIANAFCIQMQHSSPAEGAVFKFGKRAKGHLLALIGIIKKGKYFDYAAQNAIWCITDHQDIYTINSKNSVENKILREYVSKVVGQKLVTPYRKAKRQQMTKVTIADKLVYSDRVGGNYSFYILDNQGNKVYTLYENRYEKPAFKITRDFSVTFTNFASGTYYLEIIKNEEEIIYKKEIKIE